MSISKIEWTQRTWNPILGCDKVSPGCKNCYAMRMAWRLQHNPVLRGRYEGLTEKTQGGAVNWTGSIRMVTDVLHQPLDAKKPALWFVNSMSDLFHESLSFGMIDQIFDVMDAAHWHTFQILTKRPSRMKAYFDWKYEGHGLKFGRWPLANVWLGTSIEDQERGKERLKALLNTPAVVRFVSCEPLLSRVSLGQCLATEVTDVVKDALRKRLHWVIVGGESGPDARPMHPDWARSLRDECTELGIPFFFKQWGEYIHNSLPFRSHLHWSQKAQGWLRGWRRDKDVCIDTTGKKCLIGKDFVDADYPVYPMWQAGKKTAGRLLDGMVWDQMPAQY